MNKLRLLLLGLILGGFLGAAPGQAENPSSPDPKLPDEANLAGTEPGLSYYYFLRARESLAENDPAGAEKLIRKALELDPGSSSLVVELALVLFGLDRKDEADTLLQGFLKNHPDSVPVRKVVAGMIVSTLGNDYSASADARAAWQRAVQEYNEILKIDPNDKEALFYLGRLYFAANLPDRAEEYLKRYLEVDRNSLDGALFLAQLYLGRDKNAEALAVLDQAEKAYPDVVQIRLLKAKIQEKTQKVGDAEKTYQDLIAKNAFDPNAYLSYARILQEKGLHEKAVEILETAIANHVRNVDILSMLGMSLQKLNRHEKAIQAFQDAVEEDPTNPENLYYLAVAYSLAGDSMTAAKTLNPVLNKLDSDPSLFEIQNVGVFKRAVVSAMTTFSLDCGQDDEALGLLARLMTEFPESVDDDLFVKMAGIHRRRGEYDKALEVLARGEKQFPASTAIFTFKAETMAAAGRWDEAAKAFEERLKEEKKDRGAIYFGFAAACTEAKKWDKAMEVVTAGLKEDPERKGLQFQRGVVLERSGKYTEADAAFSEFIKGNPDNTVALNYLGYMLIDFNLDVDRGMGYVRQALGVEPLNPAYLDSLGWGFYRKKDFPKALEYLLKSIAGIAGDATVFDHVGDAYLATQNPHKAREFYEKSITLQRDPAEREKVRKKLQDLKPKLQK